MDPELKNLLEENLKLSKENHELLLKVHSIQRWAQITRVMYWFIILGLSLGSFYFIKPFVGNLTSVYTGGSGISNISNLTKNLSDQQQVQELLKALNQ